MAAQLQLGILLRPTAPLSPLPLPALHMFPGQPSGRALLPETLDSADDLRAELSPSPHHHKRQHQPAVSGESVVRQQQQWPPGSDRGGGGDGSGDEASMLVDSGEGVGAGRSGGAVAGAAAAARRRRRSGDCDGVDAGDGGSLEKDLEVRVWTGVGGKTTTGKWVIRFASAVLTTVYEHSIRLPSCCCCQVKDVHSFSRDCGVAVDGFSARPATSQHQSASSLDA
jgi:hypothetical protein